jgi:phage minor structural protein
LSSVVEVYDDNTLLFHGRVLDDTRDIYNFREYLCEGQLAFLHDSIVRPYDWQGDVAGYFESLIDSHNSQVDTDKQFTVRNVTVTDPNNYINRASIQYPDTLAEITEKLLDNLGGYLFIENVDGVAYIDYLEDSPYISLQDITLGTNLMQIKNQSKGSEIITALIPLGAKITDEQPEDDYGNPIGDAEEYQVDITSVTEGNVDYVFDQMAVDTYGWIFGMKVWDDVTDPTHLMNKGIAELAKRVTGWQCLELSALDLSLCDSSIDEFRFMEYVQIKIPTHNIDTNLLITEMTTDLLTPTNSKITIGNETRGISSFIASAEKKVTEISKDYVVNEQIKNVINSILNVSSQITQSADNIMSQVSELYVGQSDYQQQLEYIATQITQTASDITFTFDNLSEQINNISGDTQAQFNETSKYIRFVDGTIIIGQDGDPLEVHISNDTMGFIQNGVQVAYINSNKLYVTDGEFIKSLVLGNFAFFPRANGNLSFRKVK